MITCTKVLVLDPNTSHSPQAVLEAIRLQQHLVNRADITTAINLKDLHSVSKQTDVISLQAAGGGSNVHPADVAMARQTKFGSVDAQHHLTPDPINSIVDTTQNALNPQIVGLNPVDPLMQQAFNMKRSIISEPSFQKLLLKGNVLPIPKTEVISVQDDCYVLTEAGSAFSKTLSESFTSQADLLIARNLMPQENLAQHDTVINAAKSFTSNLSAKAESMHFQLMENLARLQIQGTENIQNPDLVSALEHIEGVGYIERGFYFIFSHLSEIALESLIPLLSCSNAARNLAFFSFCFGLKHVIVTFVNSSFFSMELDRIISILNPMLKIILNIKKTLTLSKLDLIKAKDAGIKATAKSAEILKKGVDGLQKIIRDTWLSNSFARGAVISTAIAAAGYFMKNHSVIRGMMKSLISSQKSVIQAPLSVPEANQVLTELGSNNFFVKFMSEVAKACSLLYTVYGPKKGL